MMKVKCGGIYFTAANRFGGFSTSPMGALRLQTVVPRRRIAVEMFRSTRSNDR